jgi:tetratricopeptide (TPR) repeat protein
MGPARGLEPRDGADGDGKALAPTDPEAIETESPAPLPTLERPRVANRQFVVARQTPPPMGWLEGSQGLRRAQEIRGESKLPILVYFRTDWCPHCKKLERRVFPDAQVMQELRRVVRVRINPERGAENRAVGKEFRVKGYPHLVLLSPLAGRRDRLRLGGEIGPPALLTSVARVFERYVGSYLKLARRRLRSRRYDEAMRYLDLGLGLRPEEPRLHGLRGTIALEAGYLEASKKDFEAVLQQDPDELDTKATLAYVEYLRGDDAQTIWHLDRVLQLKPEYRDGWAHYLRATAKYQRGKLRGAHHDAQRACGLGSSEGCELEGWVADIIEERTSSDPEAVPSP